MDLWTLHTCYRIRKYAVYMCKPTLHFFSFLIALHTIADKRYDHLHLPIYQGDNSNIYNLHECAK